MLQKKQFFIFLGAYAALRLFSYISGPETPLQTQHWLNAAVTAGVLLAALYFFVKNDTRGWYIVALEIILGGAGGFLSLYHLSLRTWLLAASLAVFTFQKIKAKTIGQTLTQNLPASGFVLGLVGFAALQALHGLLNHHDPRLVIADFIPYLFLLYYFPLRELAGDNKFRATALSALAAAVAGNVLFILLTFTGFSAGIFSLQDAYYHWYRDAAQGKITALPYRFYRLVLNEHLLLAPLLFYFLYNRFYRRHIHAALYTLLSAALLIILSLNLTRIYLSALVIGLLALFNRAEWRRWLIGSLTTAIFFGAAFTAIHSLASRGASPGWEIFGLRLQSIVNPIIEESSLSRMLLLPKIIEKIKASPLIGEGLGATVSVYSPIFKKMIVTPHFDWGYLELFAELGAAGLLIWFFFIVFIFRAYVKKQRPNWQLAGLLALLAINVTSPALFHALGIIWFAVLLAFPLNRPNDAFLE